MSKSDKPRCSGRVTGGQGFGTYPCSFRGKVERDGKWFCGTHDPERLSLRQEARDREREERLQARHRRSEIRMLCHELGVKLAELQDVNIPPILLPKVKKLRELRGY